MASNEDRINILSEKVKNLTSILARYQDELVKIQQELLLLKQSERKIEPVILNQAVIQPVLQKPEEEKPVIVEVSITEKLEKIVSENQPKAQVPEPAKITFPQTPKTPSKSNKELEDYIGGNVISKIGIVILIIGLGIFVKYAIDHNMISPILRIMLAYIAGAVLIGLAFKLKEKYLAYSAVLLSGGVATLYFTTFIAYDFYQLIPRMVAFAIMLIISSYAVFAAVKQYKQQIIGIIGLVGAYVVPILLSNNSGEIAILLTYIAIIDIVILIISYRLNWLATNFVAFGFTWLIYLAWFSNKYEDAFQVKALTFAVIFHIIFYAIILVYKVIKKAAFKPLDVGMLIINTSLFFSIGMYILDHSNNHQSIFTFLNALFNIGIAFGILRFKDTDKNIFFTIIGIGISYITITIPVWLDGNWISILWALEAVVLFSVGRIRKTFFYELGGYILLILACFSLALYWAFQYHTGGYDFLLNRVFVLLFLYLFYNC